MTEDAMLYNAPPQATSLTPGQELYAWFIADSRPPHSHLPWTQLTRRQQGIYELWAIHRGRWAIDTQADKESLWTP
jgi:hypothetical protein